MGTLQQRIDLSLYVVQTAAYERLNIVDMTRPYWILSHVLWGEVHTSACGIAATACAGEVMLHVPHLPFSESAAGPGTHQWMAFDVAVGEGQVLFRLHPVCPVVTLRDAACYARSFDRLEPLCAGHAPPAGRLQEVSTPGTRFLSPAPLPISSVGELQTTALALDLFAQVLDGWALAGSPPRPLALQTAPDRFQAVLAYMQARLHEKLTRDDLARHAHLHPGSFDRAFRIAHGTSPLTLLRDMRLRRARQLLERTDDTLDAIAHQCGMGEAAHFSRVFRAHVGQSPGQWRQDARRSRAFPKTAGMPYGIEE